MVLPSHFFLVILHHSPKLNHRLLLLLSLISLKIVFLEGTATADGGGGISSSSDGHHGSSSSFSFTSAADARRRPPFVAHVTEGDVREAIVVANERHEAAVKQALENYPTDDDDDDTMIRDADGEDGADDEFLDDSIELRGYDIEAPGSLPDFATELDGRIYVTDPRPLLTKEECDEVIEMAERYFRETNGGEWTVQRSGRYDVSGFWIKDVPEVHRWFVRTVKDKLFPLLARTFPDFVDDSGEDDLCVDNSYLFKYTPESGGRSDVHTDSGCLSFTVALSSTSDYEGGGTWFEGLAKSDGSSTTDDGGVGNNILEMDVGQVTIRPGGFKHCGHAVESGVRYIIGGFCMHKRKCEVVRQLLTPGRGEALHLSQLEAAVAINPQYDAAYNLLANAYRDTGQVEKARQVLEHCLSEVHPGSSEVAYMLGCICYEANEYEKTKRCMEICLQMDDHDTDAMRYLAQCCNALNDPIGEEAAHRRILATPSAPPKHISGAYTNLGALYSGTDDEITFYQKAIESNPNGACFEARYSLGSAFANRQRWDDAIQSYRQALEAQQGDNDPISEDKRTMALRNLYKSAGFKMKASVGGSAPATRAAIVKQMQELMGVDNYNSLASITAASKGTGHK